MQVSIIIVNYNTKALLCNCLASIFEHVSEIEFEVIVSDNGSKDGSIEAVRKKFPNVILIENHANLGFGAANNRALQIAKGEFVFYLNSDTILLNNAVKIFYDYWKKNDDGALGALGCNLLDGKGNVTSSHINFCVFNPSKIILDLLRANYGLWKIFFLKLFKNDFSFPSEKQKIYKERFGEVDFIVGADLFLKNDENAKFDEKFFLYCEETDLEFRLARLCKKRLLISGPKIVHLEGQSSKANQEAPFKALTQFSSRWNNISRIYFCRKNISRFAAFIIKTLTIFMWLNPVIAKHNFKYLKDLFRA